MPRQRKDEKLLNRLESVFLKRGFRQVTVADLAAELKCSRRRLYEYAPGKEELFLFVISRFFENIRNDGLKKAAKAPDLDRKIRVYLEVGVEGAVKLSNTFQEDVAGFPAGKKIYDEHQRLRMRGLRHMIESGIAEGVFRKVNARLAAEMMLLIVQRVRQPEFQREAGITFAQGLTESASLLRHGLLHPDFDNE